MFFIKFDSADKNAIFHSLVHSGKENTSIILRLTKIMHFMTYPFQSQNFVMRFSSGKMFEKYLLKNKIISNQIKSNLFWTYTLEKHNISHLALVAQCDEFHCTEYKTIQRDNFYLEKKEFSMFSKQVEGNQIKLVPGEQILWFENLDPCDAEVTVFKIITLPHKIFAIWDTNAEKQSSSRIEWNIEDKNFQCFTNFVFQEVETKKSVLNVCKQLLVLHQKEFKDVLNLNWEIVCCSGKCVVLGGNSDFFRYDSEVIEEFKREYLKFVK